MIVGVTKETCPGERRVALVPADAGLLAKKGLEVLLQAGAGAEAGFTDAQYLAHKATCVEDRNEVLSKADILLEVRAAGADSGAYREDLERMRAGQVVIGMCDPLGEPQACAVMAERNIILMSLELLPRITRAQSMDVLSSMATISGYKAVLLAADNLPRLFPMMMTAAGTVTPAKVFVVGAGVAGLQAIATARRLGALVQAYDVRPVAKEQVESLGARFVEFKLESAGAEQSGGYAKAMGDEFYKKQREMMMSVVGDSDVVITTAAVPGKKSPILVTAEMVHAMQPGSVIVDLAAERGGNCELTKADETVVDGGVTIIGPSNPAAMIPYHASQMYSKNISTFLLHLVKDGKLALNVEDEIVSGTLVTQDGQVVHPMIREHLGLPSIEATGTEKA